MPLLHSKRFMYILLCTIVCIGGLLRFYKLGEHPASLSVDEVGQTYAAYSLIHTGTDPKGNFLPFYVDIFGPIGPVAVYDRIPTVLLFGMTNFSARANAAFIGTLTILVVFFLTKEITKRNDTALLTSFLTAISPWHTHFSRFGTENIHVPFYLSLAVLLLFIGIRMNRKLWIFLAIVFLFFTFYAYLAADLFILLFLIGIGFIYRHYFLQHKKFSFFLLGFIVIALIPFILMLVNYPADNRLTAVSVFRNRTIWQGIFEMGKTYIQSFSPDFLFFKGDSGMPNHFILRYSVSGFGQLYAISLPFVLLGLWTLVSNRKNTIYQVLLLWLFLYPFGSILAGSDGGGVMANRSITGVIIFQIITALGIIKTLSFFHNKFIKQSLVVFSMCFFILFTIYYQYVYFVTYPTYSLGRDGWQYGAKQIVQLFIKYEKEYDDAVMTYPHYYASDIFFKFYAPDRCQICKSGFVVDYYNPKRRQLFALPPEYISYYKLDFIEKGRVVTPTGVEVFRIGELRSITDEVKKEKARIIERALKKFKEKLRVYMKMDFNFINA